MASKPVINLGGEPLDKLFDDPKVVVQDLAGNIITRETLIVRAERRPTARQGRRAQERA